MSSLHLHPALPATFSFSPSSGAVRYFKTNSAMPRAASHSAISSPGTYRRWQQSPERDGWWAWQLRKVVLLPSRCLPLRIALIACQDSPPVLYFGSRHEGPVMPDHVSPGVYVEENGQPHSIQGLPTSTAGFIGPTPSGPLVLPSAPLTSLADFEQTGQQLMQVEDATSIPNFMWHAARAFFENGGTRLYVCRVFSPGASSNSDGLRPPRPTTRVLSIRPRTAKPH
jgi:hypothetical protein